MEVVFLESSVQLLEEFRDEFFRHPDFITFYDNMLQCAACRRLPPARRPPAAQPLPAAAAVRCWLQCAMCTAPASNACSCVAAVVTSHDCRPAPPQRRLPLGAQRRGVRAPDRAGPPARARGGHQRTHRGRHAPHPPGPHRGRLLPQAGGAGRWRGGRVGVAGPAAGREPACAWPPGLAPPPAPPTSDRRACLAAPCLDRQPPPSPQERVDPRREASGARLDHALLRSQVFKLCSGMRCAACWAADAAADAGATGWRPGPQ
jgi:hypothetical protein